MPPYDPKLIDKYMIRTRYDDELKCWLAYRNISPTTQIAGDSKDEAIVNFLRFDLDLYDKPEQNPG